MHKVWVADDDSAIRIVLEESLSSAGFETKTFATGDDLVNQLDIEQPDLILTDVQMHGMLGYDLLKHIINNFLCCITKIGYRNTFSSELRVWKR